MKRLLIVSNRLSISIERRKRRLHFQPSVGGLAIGLGSFYKSYNSLWIGWPGIALNKKDGEEKKALEARLLSEFNCYPVFLSQNDVDNYYHGFCNRTLWPLYHYFTQYVVYDETLYETYKRVNKFFCDAVMEVAKEDDIIWIHDYHLMLLPRLIREKMPDATIGFFLHIPFPSFEIFQLLPWRKEILEGLLGADLIGFHTYDYARHFLSNVRNLLGYEHTLGQIAGEDRVIRVDVFPMGIDYGGYAGATERPEVQKDVSRLHKKLGDSKLILSIDRLDYTKGIPQRLEAFNTFLKKNPHYKEKVTLILVAVPSRTQVEHYRFLKKQVDELIGKIDGEHGTIGWVPIWYLYRFLRFPTLNALYSIADVALVTPLRDGMNLIAKEYLASKTDGRGVLILSEMAGASKELGEALIVNPNNKEELVEALEKALIMPEDEQIKGNRMMQKRLQRYNVRRWAEDFVERLLFIKAIQREMCARVLTPQMKQKLVSDYRKGERRLLLLDYDGTLISFFVRPEVAKPTEPLLKLLEKLSEDPKNEMVIISGRDRDTLEKWFGNINLCLVAEHGALIKEKGWELIEPLTNDWKEEIRPILELYMDRTPGSFIEEKEFSLVWHYRKAESELDSVRVRELKEALFHLTANLNLGVLEGSKVIEVKNVGINKGRAALRWLSKEKWDFILTIGDDLTDEDIFAVLPESAYSIKVGLGPSKARFNITSQYEVRELLKELIGTGWTNF
ncbi:MAG: bifunctional alpha,alpha-trehalose-phosphate synthase (UDP-forming)/trehalose-phosphatase [Deltaproteobacteria bacterium]|nr:bifunctional alpha,alpha-trehalose-phosphate synthase (UDP-forming)/trehalose-phosphatase [Deltaproteobacteria bacterium]